MYEVRELVDAGDVCGEGVVPHAAQDAVYWTDINRGLVHRLHLLTGHLTTWTFDQPATAIATTSDPETLLLVLGGSILLWRPADDDRSRTLFQLPEWPAERLNDARVGPDGRLWFGSMQNNVAPDGSSTPVTAHIGRMFSLDRAGRALVWQTGYGIPNTVAWSPEGSTLYFGDSLTNSIDRFDFDPGKGLAGPRTAFFSGFARGVPDGSTVDAEGFLWHCRYGGGCLVRIAPDGSVDTVVEMPVANPTTCCFGGPGNGTLFITSAGATVPPDRANGGALFALTVPVAGLPPTDFALSG